MKEASTAAVHSAEELAAVNRELQGKPAEEIIRWAAGRFGRQIKMASSFGAEDVVVIDMIAKVAPAVRVFTLDTGRLHDETYEVMQRIRERYEMEIEVAFPEREAVQQLVREKGFYSFRASVENRRECCQVRKVEPLRRALTGMKAWMTGLRRDQAVTRTDTQAVEWDEGNGIMKVNPLVDWTNEQVWEYVRANGVPYNRLHDQGFPSIGCAPCTRAIEPGEDIRAGRWWWELPENKECGLHR
ncbi:MAG TPA: phosphoadenylyl-sulfate reductase [Dehalococcoidia bacterium]|nr:phosphoadenylyl-sulfate reductase [Dehalococcoidia bacterium]